MRRSIATVSLSGTLEEKLAAAAQVGFDGVEIFENDLLTCASTPADVRRRAEDLGLGIELYQPFRDFEAVPPELLRENLRRAEHKFTLMAELGVDTMLVCSSVSPAAAGDDGLATAQLRLLAERAAGHGMRIAYEALAWGRHVNLYAHSWRIVVAADHPSLGVCLDSFHILSRPPDPAGIRDIPGDRIFFLQLSDAPRLLMDVLQVSRHYRCFPGQGGFDLGTFLEHVLATGYRGPLSLEVFNDVLRQADAERTATDGLRSLIALEEQVRLRRDGPAPAPPAALQAPAAEHAAPVAEHAAPVAEHAAPVAAHPLPAANGSPAVAAAPAVAGALPPAVPLTGYAFVEITVDPIAEMAAEQLLRGMGFALTARHRSKPVRMWRQGQARILLNRARPSAEEWARGTAAISAIAVESHDPARSARRAQALLAPAIPRRYGPGEADLFAAEAPDGTAVFFCRTEISDASSWLGDFTPLPPGEAGGAGTVGRVDHVALSQPPYYFDEAALFYQSVLGLRRCDSVEIADPYGLVRSRAMTGDAGGVRLVLNVPALGGGRLPGSAAFQHVAFGCADIFAAAVDMRVRGLPTLPVPGNYYDDLAARTRLDPGLIDTMRAYGVLYERGERGEFFHFYTAMLGRRMFFEIVQRVGGYDGYGTANTPIRMAAQYRHTALAGLTE
jgi:4-hydroxyphenylpyruvate dioxygenase